MGFRRVALGALMITASLLALVEPLAARERVTPLYGAGILSGALPQGGHYVLTAPSSMPLTALELWYRVPSIGYGPAIHPSLGRLAAQSAAASSAAQGLSLGEYVASIGGTLSIDVFPDSVAITALVPSPEADATLRLLTGSYFSPHITDAGLHRAKLDMTTEAMYERFDPSVALRNALFAGLFVAGPEHYATLDAHDVAALDLPTVQAFAERAFRPQHASLVVTGATAPSLLTAIMPSATITNTTFSEQDELAALQSTPGSVSTPRFVPFSQPGGGLAWLGPDIDDELSATAMDFIADYLFHPIDGKVTRQLATALPDVTLNGQFITLQKPGIFLVGVSGPGSGAALHQIRQQIQALTKPLPPDVFLQARRAFSYHIQSELQTPTGLAASFGWYATEGSPGYAPGAQGADSQYDHDIAALSARKVAEVAQTFLQSSPLWVTLEPSQSIREKTH